jgi:hypothetical protein
MLFGGSSHQQSVIIFLACVIVLSFELHACYANLYARCCAALGLVKLVNYMFMSLEEAS